MQANAQRETRQEIDAEGIGTLELKLNEVFLVDIQTISGNTIIMETRSEGEYTNNISLDLEFDEDKLTFTSNYAEILTGGYDKLSAHKVFSFEVHLKIPENLNVIIESNLASVKGKGNFENLFADLKQGYCRLSEFSGNATINTYRGDIQVETSKAKIEAQTRNGKKIVPEFMAGTNLLRLTSIDGDISVRKTK